MPNRRQAIIWTNADPIHICDTRGNELYTNNCYFILFQANLNLRLNFNLMFALVKRKCWGQCVTTQCRPVLASAMQCIDVILLTWFNKAPVLASAGANMGFPVLISALCSADQCVLCSAYQCVPQCRPVHFSVLSSADQCGGKYVNEVSNVAQCALQCCPVRAHQCCPVHSQCSHSAFRSVA